MRVRWIRIYAFFVTFLLFVLGIAEYNRIRTFELELIVDRLNFEFKNGLWSTGDEGEVYGYYLFSHKSGYYIDVDSGMKTEFKYIALESPLRTSNKRFEFTYLDSNVTIVVEVKSVSPDGSVTLEWGVDTDSIRTEVITYVDSGRVALTKSGILLTQFYSSFELSELSLNYYEMKYGYRPASASWVNNFDNTVSLQLYDRADDYDSIVARYVINRFSGIGYNKLTGDEIDLTNVPYG